MFCLQGVTSGLNGYPVCLRGDLPAVLAAVDSDSCPRRHTRSANHSAGHTLRIKLTSWWRKAALAFRKAEVMQAERQPQYPLLYSLGRYRYCELLLDPLAIVAGDGRPDQTQRRSGRNAVRGRKGATIFWIRSLGGGQRSFCNAANWTVLSLRRGSRTSDDHGGSGAARGDSSPAVKHRLADVARRRTDGRNNAHTYEKRLAGGFCQRAFRNCPSRI